MIVETGHFALALALALALMQVILPFWGARAHDGRLMATARPLALTQFALVALAYAALTYAHVVSDFSLVNVVENSHSTKPMLYKISGVWGNHEGSMMLWALILTLSGAAMALFSRAIPPRLLADATSVQGLLSVAFLLFILLTSDPFVRLDTLPIEGNDLNPILQDPGLAIHPPLLYIGYVGFSIVFSLAAGALIGGRTDAAFARFIRPWTLAAWIFLTLGIAMGSYWAYYTLGWGGFWFWDPVENASLLPWLAGTALLHSAAVMEKRDSLKIWTIFLAILTFSLSLLGTFLVRSGVLTSVHAFASDPQRGLFILGILVLFIGGALFLFMLRAPTLTSGGLFAPISREGFLVVNNLLLTASCAAVFIGTLYPLALEAWNGSKITVGAPFFNLTFGPLFAPILILAPLGQLLAWKRGDLFAAAQRLFAVAVLGLVAMLGFYAFQGGPAVAVIGAGVAVYLMVAAFAEIWSRVFPQGFRRRANAFGRLTGLPLSAWGGALAHAGLGVTLLGLAATGWGVEKIATIHPNESFAVGPYALQATSVDSGEGPNYREAIVHMAISRDGKILAKIDPSKRFFKTRQMATSQAGIVTLNLGQVYVAVAEQNADGSFDARMYWKPLVSLIWLGALVMALGGSLSLADRRLRVGVARRAKLPAGVQAAE
ncbi:heme lyase NrfEFG subunit NrfE [Rhodoblastus sphagnicola]|uniref:Heme lyase NrfEFG subunit NrfE n=1 Tax=Rhodoblastus sphagnicola TaxID=333368 RepID=A0A2S6N6I3_9HYPH|nr:heme lyase CcmF/NrfE family subunit [Rhodoblastus sphagnicola]MBB4197704.1 cytochrome c-type biogenesis protein CcmF [Rhodoblastus sphagnicola]PPQ30197.1 heme lyase NrfEFG subunit NrfE [Rhodoblastus sphagnicola]